MNTTTGLETAPNSSNRHGNGTNANVSNGVYHQYNSDYDHRHEGKDDGYSNDMGIDQYENRYYVHPQDRIAIIGAGVAGIAMASALHNANYNNFIVYEKQSSMGGLWCQNYPNVAVQTSPHQYEYPGYPYPDHIRNRKDPPCPTGEEVRDYLHNFCTSQNIIQKFQYNTVVSNISKNHTTGIWTLVTSVTDPKTKVSKTSVQTFSFVIMCSGLFSNTPHMINIPGMDDFVQKGNGKVIHTSQWKDIEEFRNQNVIIIGNGKSAADAAVGAAKMAKISQQEQEALSSTNTYKVIHPPIQCIRKQNWYVPRAILRYKFLFHSRLVAQFLPRYFEDTSLVSQILHFLVIPIKFFMWRLLEFIFLLLMRLPYKVWPRFGTIDTENSLSVPLLVTDERHLQPIRKGEIDMRITQVKQLYSSKHAQLTNGDIVPVDVIVMGTGWKLDYSFLDNDSVKSKLDIDVDGLWLYRNILAPNLTGIAFIGCNALTFMNIYSSYVQAYWLVHLISGNREPLSSNDMNVCIQREKIFKRKHYPNCAIRGASIEAYMQHYLDILFTEQGIDPCVYSLSKTMFAPIYNILWPIIPETVTQSFDTARAKFYLSKK